jgi:phi13 family phage major tail protein
MADNKVRFGLDNVAIAFLKDDGSTYDTPVKIKGAVNLSTSPEGDSEIFYADNTPYYTCTTNSGYTGDLEIALLPDDIKAKIYGWSIDNNGALVEDADAVAQTFALLFEVSGDQKKRRNVFYSCTASRPEEENKTTEDSTTPTTETLSITMIPREINNKKVTKLSIELTSTNKEVYDSFYTSVLEPSFAEA